MTVNNKVMEDGENLPLHSNDPLTSLIREDLDPYSINELEDRITLLQSEIARCEAKKAAASSHRSVADQLFKKG